MAQVIDLTGDSSDEEMMEREWNGPFHHPGDLEIDEDLYDWPDHDERCHGEIDSNEMRRAYPQNFSWDCCKEPGDAPGCKQGKGPTVVERYPDSPEISENEEHSGFLEVEYNAEIWADHDEDCHGVIDTNTNRREFPEGFVWSCCNLPGDSEFCSNKELEE